MINISKQELIISKEIADRLTKDLTTPKNEWEYSARVLFKFEIILEDLLARKIITKHMAKKYQNKIAPLSYWTYLNSEEIKNNEKIKKNAKILILNDNLDRIGLSKFFSIFDC